MWQECVKDTLVVVITAVVSGLTVPYILQRIESRKTVEEQRRAEILQRQKALIDAQAAFLDRFNDLLWEWRYLSVKLSYYGITPGELYESAKKDYAKDIWGKLNTVRAQISKARRLVTEERFAELISFYKQMVELDLQLRRAQLKEEDGPLLFADLNAHIVGPLSDAIDNLLHSLGNDFELSESAAERVKGILYGLHNKDRQRSPGRALTVRTGSDNRS